MTRQDDLIYRPAAAGDARVLANMQTRAWSNAYRNMVSARTLHTASPEARVAAWRIALDRQSHEPDEGVVVAERGSMVIGFGAFAPQRRSVLAEQGFGHEIGVLIVVKAEQRQGVGRAVLRRVFSDIEEAGGQAASIRVTRSNQKGRDFVEGTGAEMLDDGLGNAAHVLDEVTYGWRALRLMRRPVDLRSLTRPHDPDRVSPAETPQ